MTLSFVAIVFVPFKVDLIPILHACLQLVDFYRLLAIRPTVFSVLESTVVNLAAGSNASGRKLSTVE